MNHVIIGLSEIGAQCLSQVNNLCEAGFTDADSDIYTLFYIESQSKLQLKLPFVSPKHIFSLPDTVQLSSLQTVKKILTDTLPNQDSQQIDNLSQQKNRRFYSECFRTQIPSFIKTMDAIVERKNIFFHIVVNLSDIAMTGISMEILLHLFRRYNQGRIFIHLFYTTTDEQQTAQNLAATYATLLEFNIISSERIYFFVHHYDPATQSVACAICVQQIYSLINATPLSMGLNNDINASPVAQNHFFNMGEVTFDVNTEKVRANMSQDFSIDLIEKLLFASQTQTDSPAWIDQLLDDKKWLLHMDFLSMDQDINYPNTEKKWVSVNQEWGSRVLFFLEKQKSGLDWGEQVQDIANSLSTVAQKLFRGRGVGLFYTVNESGISATAKLIAKQIETAIIESWKETFCPLHQLHDWLNESIAQVSRRLGVCHNRRVQQGDLSRQILKEYKAILQEWENASKGAQRKIEKRNSIENMASMLEQYYTADCHTKAMTFACKLLLATLGELDDTKKSLETLITTAEQQFAQVKSSSVSVSVDQDHSSLFKESWEIMPVSGSLNHLSLLSLKNDDPLLVYAVQKITESVQAEDGLNSLIQIVKDEQIIQDIAHNVLQKHPLFQSEKSSSLDITLFWEMIKSFLADFQETFSKIVQGFSGQNSTPANNDNSAYFWIIPPCPVEKDLLDQVIHLCQNILPESKVLINVKMIKPQLLLRRIDFTSFGELPDINRMQEAYDQLIFAPEGVAWSLLLHTQATLPFPDYQSRVLPPVKNMHDVRQKLLLGELYGIIKEASNAEIYLLIGNSPIRLGSHFPDAQTNITPWKIKLLNAALANAQNKTSAPTARQYLQNRLEEIKLICLNGKTDIHKASWQEAGQYVSWARAGEELLATLTDS